MPQPRPSNAAQVASPAFRVAALDADFLAGDSTRGVRLQLEYEKTEEILRAFGVVSTVVVFGSSRARERGEPRAVRWYAEARDFGRLASIEGGAARPRDGIYRNVIATGGGPGIMEAANRGAREAGAPTIGFNITLPREQAPNPYTTPELTFQFHYFAMRKLHFAMRAKALVVFPGGFGTLDELFELLTLVQTRKLTKKIFIILYGSEYWNELINFKAMVKHGMIAETDLNLFQFADDPESALEMLKESLAVYVKPDEPGVPAIATSVKPTR